MKSLVNMPDAEDRLSLIDVPEPEPHDDEAIVSVRSFSINRGELALMRNRPKGWRPGQDIAGVIERPAKNGKGPGAGVRVAALIEGAGWTERVAVPLERLAAVPDGVALETAGGLPMVGLTALALVQRCGSVLGRSIVVTGARGGVGSVLVQLCKLAGAEVTAIARGEHATWLTNLGARKVVSTIADNGNEKFDVIFESVGGSSLEEAIGHISPGGRIICFGNSSATNAAFNMFSFFGAENAALETFFSYRAMIPKEIGRNLAYLLRLVASGRLDVQTTVFNWKDTRSALAALEGRDSRGKIVLVTSS